MELCGTAPPAVPGDIQGFIEENPGGDGTREMNSSWISELVAAAATPYRAVGCFAWYFARGKLRGDPIFTALLERGLIPPQARIHDLGCGQGLLAAWLLAAQSRYVAGDWPRNWPPAPQPTWIHGIEMMPRDVWRARRALGESAEFVQGDIRTGDFGPADAVVIFDVLHYFDFSVQDRVLRRVRDSLCPQGVLLLRVGDAAGGLRFLLSYWVDLLVIMARGHRLRRLYCRSVADWTGALDALGFTVDALPMSRGTPFANVLLVARLRKAHG